LVKCGLRKCEWVFCELKCEPARDWSDIFRPTGSLPSATAFEHSWNFLSGNNRTCIPIYTTRVSAYADNDNVIIYAYPLLQGTVAEIYAGLQRERERERERENLFSKIINNNITQ